MTSTYFIDGTTPIVSSWLNDVNNVTYSKTFADGTVALSTAPGSSLDSSAVSYVPSGTGAVTTTVQSKLRQYVNIFDFMTTAQIADVQAATLTLDVTAVIQAAITANNGNVILFPAGKYKITSRLDFGNVGIEGVSERGSVSSLGGVEFSSYVPNDYALTVASYRGQSYKKFTIKSYLTNQSGICIFGSHPIVELVRVEGFDTVSFRAGSGSLSTIVPAPIGFAAAGCYYAKVDNIYIANTTITGSNAVRGFLDDGGFPSSNANTYRNVVVSGRFDILYQVNGTNNSLYGGDCDPVTTVAIPTAAYKIGGINIKIHEPYYELGFPTYLYWFDANSFSCEVSGVHMQGSTASGGVQYNTYSKILDEGWANNVAYLPVGYNYQFPQKNISSQNLISNSNFLSFNDTVGTYTPAPTNWTKQGGTWSRDSSVVRGSSYSVTATAAANSFNLAFAIASTNTNDASPNQITLDDLRGRTLVAAVWCKTSVAGLGNIKIQGTSVGGVGVATHSGSGNWELLTCLGKISSTATTVSVQLRNANSGNSTGQAWFSEPVCFFGVDLAKEEPRPLTDKVAQMFGPLLMSPFQLVTDGATTPDVSYGNCFTFTNTAGTTITNFVGVTNRVSGQILYLFPTNGNTTLKNNATIKTTTGADKVLSANTVYKLVNISTVWYEF